MISVLMPVYNAESYLRDSIESILKQDFQDFEFLIFDDCSEDGSYEIIREYAKNDKRIIFDKKTKNEGYTKLLNEMSKNAKFEYLARMDADDISERNRFSKQLDFIHSRKDFAVVGSFIKIIDLNNNFIRKSKYPVSDNDIKINLKKYCTFAHPSTVIRKSFFDEVGGYREIFEPAEDYDLWTRLITISKAYNLPEYLLCYREHSVGASQKRREEQLIKTEFIKKNYLFLIKGEDLVKSKNIKKISEDELFKFINKDEFFFEKNYSLIANYFKNKKMYQFACLFLKTFFNNPYFLIKKIFQYIQKKFNG